MSVTHTTHTTPPVEEEQPEEEDLTSSSSEDFQQLDPPFQTISSGPYHSRTVRGVVYFIVNSSTSARQ